MKFGKKTISSFVAGLACVSMLAVSASAATNSKPVAGYGTLSGEIYDLSIGTDVSINPDNAYLTVQTVIQDINGNQLGNTGVAKSNRGVTTYGNNIIAHPDGTYVLYGTHGVQGGTTYGAQAVYTYTHAPR